MVNNGRELQIAALDDFPLAATLYEPGTAPSGVAIISAAMAVPRRFYKDYAYHLSRKGYLAITYDYRGIGGSLPGKLRGFKGRMRDWAELDMAGVIEWVSAHYPGSDLVLIGHSIGGQAAGLISNSDKVSAMVTVAAQSGYWGLQPGSEKYRAWFFVHVVFPLTSHIFGYLPWSRFVSGEDLPKGAALEWARWARSPDYLFGDRTLHSLRNVKSFTAPILAYSFEDDVWGSKRSVDDVMRRYEAASVERRHKTPEDVGGARIGHLGFFLPGAEVLWDEVDQWLTRTIVSE
jgi:predicted alpha/beta hydrolase